MLAELSFFFCQLCAKEISQTVAQDLEKAAPVLLYKLEKIFPPDFFLPMQHLIVHLPSEARLGGARTGPLVLSNREMSKDSSQKNVQIKPELRLPLQRQAFGRRLQTSRHPTTSQTFLASIIHPLVTMLAKLNRPSAFSNTN